MTHLFVVHKQPAEMNTGAVLHPSHRWRQEYVWMFFMDELWITEECFVLYVGFWLLKVENDFSSNINYKSS